MLCKRISSFLLLYVLCVLHLASAQVAPPPPKGAQQKKNVVLPPCKLCRTMVESFNKAMNKTSRGKHAGGDAAWEESKLRDYKTSEVRLAEVQEQLCRELSSGTQDQCLNMSNEQEPLLEDWFFHKQNEHPELQDWLCVQQLKLCCPPAHYGPECKKCLDCNGNGKCKGEGTRKGNGKCACDAGYAGIGCNKCANNYYESFRDASKLLCSPCHAACTESGGCKGAGPKGCVKCKEGWRQRNGECADINECAEDKSVCRINQFCVNGEGSYKCLECDRSCDGCYGDGPDMCNQCAETYTLKNGRCIAQEDERREYHISFTRYATYFGMCFAVCVILKSHTTAACLTGLAVALYITASEYQLRTSPKSGLQPGGIDAQSLEDALKKTLLQN